MVCHHSHQIHQGKSIMTASRQQISHSSYSQPSPKNDTDSPSSSGLARSLRNLLPILHLSSTYSHPPNIRQHLHPLHPNPLQPQPTQHLSLRPPHCQRRFHYPHHRSLDNRPPQHRSLFRHNSKLPTHPPRRLLFLLLRLQPRQHRSRPRTR